MSLTVKSGNDLSTLFSSMNNSANAQNGISGLSGLISEYNSIRSGAYSKLAKQYYSGDASKKKGIADDKFSDVEGKLTNKTEKLQKDSEIKENKELISNVSTFRKSLSSVKSDDTLFAAKDDSKELDYDKIYSKLSSFAKSYNEVIKNGADSDSDTVLRNVLNMTKTVDSYKKQLEQIGFKIGDDNTLSIDKEAVQAGNMDTAKSLFGKTSSFANQLDTLSTNVASQAASDVYSLGGYTSTGAYKQTLETIYNTTI